MFSLFCSTNEIRNRPMKQLTNKLLPFPPNETEDVVLPAEGSLQAFSLVTQKRKSETKTGRRKKNR